MTVAVTLNNLNDSYFEQVIVENIDNKRCFTYLDNNNATCEMCIYDDGLCFFKQDEDHILELHLKDNTYAKITTSEGTLKFDAKVIDFQINSDILVMHYIVNDEERILQVKYY